MRNKDSLKITALYERLSKDDEQNGESGYNKKDLERELQNESRQHNRQQSRVKRRKEEI
nr:hypothetical protein [uncultured Acetatifactor sp.]